METVAKSSLFMSRPLAGSYYQDFLDSVSALYLLNAAKWDRAVDLQPRHRLYGDEDVDTAARTAASECWRVGCWPFLDILWVEGGVAYAVAVEGLKYFKVPRFDWEGEGLLFVLNGTRAYAAGGDLGLLKGATLAGYLAGVVQAKHGGYVEIDEYKISTWLRGVALWRR